MKNTVLISAVVISLLGCAGTPAPVDLDAATQDVLKASFRDQGIATVDRLKQDLSNEACSKAETGDVAEKIAKAIEADAAKTIKKPSDGKYLGDWKVGETIAQSGRGATWTDAPVSANGGNCYNCHQISKQELSHGTLGPSLYNYGKLRGNSQTILDYTWGKIYNSKASNACSGMPRFGHAGLLTEKQMQDIMALLLDPESPVNK